MLVHSQKIKYIGILLVVLALGAGMQILLFGRTASTKLAASYQAQSGAGISLNSLVGAPESRINQELSDVSSLGFTWIRMDIRWPIVQPNNATEYKWALYDPAIAAANRYHLKVLGILDYAPPWAAQAGCIKSSSCAPTNPAEFAVFAGQAALHYRQSVQDWEIWNEENSSHAWSPAANATQYAAVLQQSYTAIKATNPNAVVVLGGMAVSSTTTSGKIKPLDFLQQLYAAGAGGYFDAVGYHPYSYPAAPNAASPPWAQLAALHNVMQANGDGSKQIWITEYGAPTNGPAGSGFVSEAAQAQLARQAYSAAQGQSWIGPFFWYTYQDRSTDISTKENFFGLKRADGSPKAAYYAWQQLLAK